MIHVDLKGRLGNKLFQLATGISLAKENNTKISISDSSLLNFLNINALVQPTPKDFTLFTEPGFEFNKIPYKPNIILNGYFQSEKYFDNNREDVLAQISLKDKYYKALINKYEELLKNYTTISIHIRRTDYLALSDHYINLNIDYYKAAIGKFKLKNTKFLIFSDDINWCKTRFIGDKFVYIENNLDIEDLFLMSLCNHNIIANSSFSWWGSYLNKFKDKKVIAPSKWFGEKYKNFSLHDLYCKNWDLVELETK